MTNLFRFYTAEQCPLCGGYGKPTREHKIKASILKKEFGSELGQIGHMDESGFFGKNLQSPKSDHLKFKTHICEECNTRRTQPADIKFDEVASNIFSTCKKEPNLQRSIALLVETITTKENTDFFRYLAKVLCCFLAETDSPIPLRLSDFSIGNSSENGLRFELVEDYDYTFMSNQLGEFTYAAHGGLSVIGNKCLDIQRFMSSITFGPIRMNYDFELNKNEQSELRQKYPEFLIRAAEAAGIATANN